MPSTDNVVLTIRPATLEDAPRCGDIAVAAWEPVYASFRRMIGQDLFDHEFTGWEENKRRQVESHITQYTHLAIVTQIGDQVAGFLTFRLFEDRKTGEISNNAVDPAFQGHGVGTAQCNEALRVFREAGMQVATVLTGLDEAHAPARRMYRKVGFSVSTPQIKYYMAL